jgi:hypothetical protein
LLLVVTHPRARMRDALVARTWELAAFLDEIHSAVLDREECIGAQRVCATHTWRAGVNVPAALAPHLDSDYFAWTAVVEWSRTGFDSRWRVVPHALRESLVCTAEVQLREALGGAGTRVCVDVDIQGLGGRRGVETLAYRVVTTNWVKLVDAAARRLQAGVSPRPSRRR